MDKANPEIERLAEQFIRQSKSISSKSEFFYRISQFERRISDSQKPWNPSPQIQQLLYQTKMSNNAPITHNPFAQGQSHNRNNNRTVSSNFRQTQPGFSANRSGNDFFRPFQADINRFGAYHSNSATELPINSNMRFNNVVTQLVRPRQQFPFQNNQFLRQHLQQQPQYVKYYKKQSPASPFHARKF